MFNKGEMVTYSTSGVCVVDACVTQSVGGKQREYYCLLPTEKLSSRILVPTDNEKLVSKIRALPTAKTLEELLKKAADVCLSWQENDAKRAEQFAQVFEEGNLEAVVGVIGCILKKREELLSLSRRLKSPDANALKIAERMFCSCVSAVFEIGLDEAVKRTENVFFEKLDKK